MNYKKLLKLFREEQKLKVGHGNCTCVRCVKDMQTAYEQVVE